MSEQIGPDVGVQLRALRQKRGLSLRALAELSGLSANAISLIERGITSPSVNTLHRLATGLGVPLVSFFVEPEEKANVILTRAGVGPRSGNATAVLENLGSGLDGQSCAPFLVTLKPGASNGQRPMTHSGHEMIYCLEGELDYEIAGERYELIPGDALLFQADLPHSWHNTNHRPAVFLLFIAGIESRQESVGQHLGP